MKKGLLIITALIALTGISCKPKAPEAPPPPPPPPTAVQAPDLQKMITARVYIKAGFEEKFIEAAKTIIEKSNQEEGCLGYMLFQNPYEKTNFIFVEKWKNQAAIDFHFATEHFKEFGTLIADWTAKPGEIKIIDVAGEK